MAGYELASAYVNLLVETRDIAKQIGGAFKGADRVAATEGTAAGKAFAKAFDKSKPIDLKDSADKAAAQVAVASKKVEKAREAEEAAARKVAIEEAKLAEQRASSTAKASQILATEDRLARAKSASALASENVENALRGETAAKAKATAANDQLEASQRDAGQAADRAGQEYLTLKDRIQAAIRGDFKGAFKDIPREADRAADKVEDEFEDSGKRAGSGFGDAFKGALAGIATYVSFDAIVGGFKSIVEETGNLEQSVGGIGAVFKDSSAQMLAWSDSAATAVGLSKNEYNELATVLGAQLKNAGTAMDELGPKTNDLIGVGADLASMFGGTTREAIESITSALRGERDPIEKYGVSLNQAAVDAKAAELGFKKVGGSLSTEANQAASLAIIMEQTADAHGNFAKETDTLANRQQVAAAQWDNLKTKLGEMFLPALTNVMTFVTDKGIPALERMSGALGAIVGTISNNLPWLAVLAVTFGAVAAATWLANGGLLAMSGGIKAVFLAISTGIKSIPVIGWVIAAIGLLVAALTWFFTKTETGQAIWEKVWNGIKVAAAAVVDWFKTYALPVWDTVMAALGTALSWLWSSVVKPVFGFIGNIAVWLWNSVIKPVFGFIIALWKNVLAPTLEWLWNSVFKPVFNFIGALIKTWWAGVKVIFNALISFWKNVLSPTITWLKNTFQAIFLLIGAIIKAWWNTTVKPVFNAVRNFVRDVLGPIFKWLYNNIIKPVWDGIGSAIKAVWNNVIKPVFQTLGNFIKDKVAPKFKGGVDAISKAWDGLKEAAKKPVRFVINKVINEGIIDRFNDIADKFPGTKDIKHLSLPKGFRSGGKVWGAGTETSDSIPARLSRNEHVLTAKDVRNLGGHDAVYKLRAMAAKSKHRGVAAFRNGGAVGVAPGFAKGGTLSDAARWLQSHGVRITEFKAWGQPVGKHANGSLHYSGQAFDANAGPGGENATEKAIFDRLVPQLNAKFPALRTLWRIPHHFNHLHVDTGSGGSVGTGGPGAQGDSAGLLDLLLSPFNKLKDKLGDQFARFGTFGSLAKGAGSKAIDAPIQWIKANISKVTDFVSDTWEGAKEGVTSGAAKTQARAWAAANNIPWNGARMSAMRWIIKRESNWNPRAQNPRSTASGLPQFINSTAKQYMGVAPAKNYSVWKQLDGMMKYVNDRYGGAVKAKEYWQRNNHYRHGGAVTPQLFDGGGLLKRGVQLVEHRSSKPDRVLSDQQWNGIYQAAVGEGNNRPIIQVTTPTVERNEVGAWLDELEFSMTHLAKSNAFSGVNG